MSGDIVLKITPISRAPWQGKLINLEWACEREGLSFPAILRRLHEHHEELLIYQDAPAGALLVGSTDFANFASRARVHDDDENREPAHLNDLRIIQGTV